MICKLHLKKLDCFAYGSQRRTKFNKIVAIFLLFISSNPHAGQAYFEKFTAYTQWSQHIPTSINPGFDDFIQTPSPLTQKLRARFLYQLAQQKDWTNYLHYYRDTPDISLQCYEQTALFLQGEKQKAIQASIPLWLRGNSQPRACDHLFDLLLTNHAFNNDLILQRATLALAEDNVSLTRYLLKKTQPAHLDEAEKLSTIYQNPMRITLLHPGFFQGELYLYGLQRLVSRNLKQAIALWKNPKANQIMNEKQHQAFLAHVALYKAKRNQDDASAWFAQIKPTFYNDILLDCAIRVALAHQKWQQVKNLIQLSKEKEEPIWQYWTARSSATLGEKEKANAIYLKLASKRNYYGFLASIQLNKKFNFENEAVSRDPQLLRPYQSITNEIKGLVQSHQKLAASRLLNDFVSELPKNEKSALVNWLANDLHWYGKSVYLSNTNDLNNQLALRFPMTYQPTVRQYAQTYQIPAVLIYAIIRQESAFLDDVVSSAGANGLMQIMPMTAKAVSKQARIPFSDPKQLFLSPVNIRIGTAYLQQLSHQFGDHPVLMAAAYNAGPRQVNYWIKNHPPKDIDAWIETLPWRETRNYLKNIIAFYAVYQYRMQESPNLDPFMKPIHTRV